LKIALVWRFFFTAIKSAKLKPKKYGFENSTWHGRFLDRRIVMFSSASLDGFPRGLNRALIFPFITTLMAYHSEIGPLHCISWR
jgi:hypothetical protein